MLRSPATANLLIVAIPLGTATALIFVWAGNELDLAVTVTGLVLLEALLVAGLSAAMALTVNRLQRSWMGPVESGSTRHLP